MDDPLSEQRDTALAELSLFGPAAVAFQMAFERWWYYPDDFNAQVAQRASVGLTTAIDKIFTRIRALYDAGVLAQRPDLDLKATDDGR